MDLQGILTAISSVGWPICCTLLCFWYVNRQGERHREKQAALVEAITNNTEALIELKAKIGG